MTQRAIAPAPSSSARSERSVIAYLAFMGMMLAFGIDSALPAFGELRDAFGLEPGSTRISLIVTVYFIGMASGQLVVGPVADRFGRQPTLLAGLALYALGAVGSIIAPSIEWLLVSRLVWGLGASAPAALRSAIARDLYAGDQMARVMSIMMGVFMLGPVLAPIIGDVILRVASWHWIFGAAVFLALVQTVWALRFGETLAVENRRNLDPTEVAAGFRAVFGSRGPLGYTMAMTFGFGGFIIFLGSSQPVIDRIYGRADQFSLWFAVASIVVAISFFTVNRYIVAYGAHRVAVAAACGAIVANLVLLVAAIGAGGVPPFLIWFSLVAIGNAFVTLLTPTCYSMALQPLGDRAGIGSGVIGFVSTAGGSVLAAIAGATIDETVVPWALGYVVYVGICVGWLMWAAGGRSELG
ncbi:MAG: MFS transporter [Acidimicrobiales bacterium]